MGQENTYRKVGQIDKQKRNQNIAQCTLGDKIIHDSNHNSNITISTFISSID